MIKFSMIFCGIICFAHLVYISYGMLVIGKPFVAADTPTSVSQIGLALTSLAVWFVPFGLLAMIYSYPKD